MDSNELKKQLLEYGATEEDLAKIDFSRVENIVDGASTIEDLCQALKNEYPDFNEEEFKKFVSQENESETDEAQDLSDEDLEAVAGGSIGSWIKNNKEVVIIASCLLATAALSPIIYKGMQRLGSGSSKNQYNKGFDAGRAEAQNEVGGNLDNSFRLDDSGVKFENAV